MTTAWSPKIEQLYENGVLINQTIQYAPQGVKEPYPQRTWVGLMRGVRVEGDTVVISVKGGNDEARELCGNLLNEMEVRRGND